MLDVAEKSQQRKADEVVHVSNTGETYALVHHICSKQHEEVAADRADKTVPDMVIFLFASEGDMV